MAPSSPEGIGSTRRDSHEGRPATRGGHRQHFWLASSSQCLGNLTIPEVMDLSGAVEGWMGGFHQSWGGGGLGGGGSENHPWMNLPRPASTYDTLETPGVVTYDGSWDLRTVVGRGGFCLL